MKLKACFVGMKEIQKETGNYYFLSFVNEDYGSFTLFSTKPVAYNYLQPLELSFSLFTMNNRLQLKLESITKA